MSDTFDFEAFPKIARWNREVIVTEKIDGTNAQVVISDDGLIVRAGSRNRFITPQDDNHGFARWVVEHHDELLTLGPGRHFGEWWGSGIQRGYGLAKGEKRFSLFNVSRWCETRPPCCHVVPVLWRGIVERLDVPAQLLGLRGLGSSASPGFMQPEGIVIFHVAGGHFFKATLGDDGHKGEARNVQP